MFEAQKGRFPEEAPEEEDPSDLILSMAAPMAAPMGVAAGGKMRQRIYPDPHGLEVWNPAEFGEVDVRIVNSDEFRALTGQDPPPSPITARLYTEHGLPWFELYDEDAGDVAASETLGRVKSVGALTGDRPETAEVDPSQVKDVSKGKRRPPS